MLRGRQKDILLREGIDPSRAFTLTDSVKAIEPPALFGASGGLRRQQYGRVTADRGRPARKICATFVVGFAQDVDDSLFKGRRRFRPLRSVDSTSASEDATCRQARLAKRIAPTSFASVPRQPR